MTEAASDVQSPTPPPLVRVSDQGAVRILTLDRPVSRNSLSRRMMAALGDALREAAGNRAVRAIVLSGNGPAFSAGHDLKEIHEARASEDRGRALYEELMTRCAALMMAIVRQPQPVIAAVEGVATAAGCQLVASCDLAVAGAEARFATPGVNIGLFCSTPMVALSRAVSSKHAMEMLLLGELIDAETALRFGLVNRAVPVGKAVETAVALGQSIASKSALTLRIGKEAFYRQREMTLEAAYSYAASVMVMNLLARDAEEGIEAFIEKRKPRWTG